MFSQLPSMPAGAISDAEPVVKMVQQWGAKRRRNVLRGIYHDGKNALSDLGISLPPQMRHVSYVLGWPGLAERSITNRVRFEGFVSPSGGDDPHGLSVLMDENSANLIIPQAVASSLTHAVCFLVITPGDTAAGEPPVVIMPKSALVATGLWDRRTNRMTDALTIQAVDDRNMPTTLVWYARTHVTTFERGRGGRWTASRIPNPTGRLWVEPLVYRPDLMRPFGRSRITRGVMSLTDQGLRVLARSESHSEFFASPQRYALGVEEEAFGSKAERWNAVMSRLLTISRDENGDLPTLGQFPQMSMQPHFEHLQQLAKLFAAETSIPLNELGVVQDNPSSAEAMFAAREGLLMETSAAENIWGDGLKNAAITAVMIRDGLTAVPDDLRRVEARWTPPERVSQATAAQAVAQKVAALPWLADTEVILEDLGYDSATIQRLLADKRRASGTQALTDTLAAIGRSGGESQER